MNVVLENDQITAGIKSLGAELYSLKNKTTGFEHMWRGDPAFWGKTSPVLFPIVGTLMEDKYKYRGKSYTLSRHGFAREHDFKVVNQYADQVTFVMESNQATLDKYPFKFKLSLVYVLAGSSLKVKYVVKNAGSEEMYFSIGAHPAFAVPVVPDTQYDEYFLEFDKIENAPRWPISAAGLIEDRTEKLLDHTNRLPLDKRLFLNDALVLKHLNSKQVSLRHNQSVHGLDFHFEGFPFLGIWAAKQADFVCIEPWCGIADSVKHDQDLTHKEGIEKLGAGAEWSRAWKVDLF